MSNSLYDPDFYAWGYEQAGQAMRDADRLALVEAERETVLARKTFPTDTPSTRR